MTLQLHALGHCHPDNEITNQFLEELDIGTSDEWILERVGIRSRRTSLPLDYIKKTRNRDPRAALEAATISNAELGAAAVRMAVERAGIQLSDVGMLISGSTAPDHSCPAEAATIAAELGIEVPVLDVNSACTSFFAQIWMLANMREEALPRFSVVVAPDAMTKTVDYSERATAVLWGDAAVAGVVSATEPGRASLLESRLTSTPSGWEAVTVKRGAYFHQDGKRVQRFAIRKAGEHLALLKEHFEDPDRRFHFVAHQANLRMIENVCRRAGIPDERHHYNVDWYGNTGAASAASVLSMQWDKFDHQDDVAMVGVGGGLTWGSYLARFNAPAPATDEGAGGSV